MKLDDTSIMQELQVEGFWITTFSGAHIGMSAIRGQLIDGCAKLAEKINIIDRGIELPSYWPGTYVPHETFYKQIKLKFSILQNTQIFNVSLSLWHVM